MSTRFPHVADQQWRTFVADVVEALELRENERVFEVQCGSGAFLLPLYEAGCTVGGIDADARLIDMARRDMPGGVWSVGAVDALDVSETWDVMVACTALDESWQLHDAADLLEKMVRKAGSAIAILDVPSGLGFDERWFLRSLSELGVASVRLPVLQTLRSGRFNVIARLR